MKSLSSSKLLHIIFLEGLCNDLGPERAVLCPSCSEKFSEFLRCHKYADKWVVQDFIKK